MEGQGHEGPHHDVHHGRVELEADVRGTNMEDHAEEALHMNTIIKTNNIMMYIMVVSNWRLMLEGQIWKITSLWCRTGG